MNQTKLSFTPAPAAFESDTSQEAAVKMTESGKHGEMQAFILRLLRYKPGMTDEEITGLLLMHYHQHYRHSSVVSSRNALVRRGLVEDSGNRRLSPTSGMRVVIWRCVK